MYASMSASQSCGWRCGASTEMLKKEEKTRAGFLKTLDVNELEMIKMSRKRRRRSRMCKRERGRESSGDDAVQPGAIGGGGSYRLSTVGAFTLVIHRGQQISTSVFPFTLFCVKGKN